MYILTSERQLFYIRERLNWNLRKFISRTVRKNWKTEQIAPYDAVSILKFWFKCVNETNCVMAVRHRCANNATGCMCVRELKSSNYYSTCDRMSSSLLLSVYSTYVMQYWRV